MPRRSVSFPATRSTNTPSGRVTFTLWLVMPPPRTSHSQAPSGQTRSTAAPSLASSASLTTEPRRRSRADPLAGRVVQRLVRDDAPTHSPKISTATSVPTPYLAGRYAKAIDDSTV